MDEVAAHSLNWDRVEVRVDRISSLARNNNDEGFSRVEVLIYKYCYEE